MHDNSQLQTAPDQSQQPEVTSGQETEGRAGPQNIYALMLAHLRRGSYSSPAASGATLQDKGRHLLRLVLMKALRSLQIPNPLKDPAAMSCIMCLQNSDTKHSAIDQCRQKIWCKAFMADSSQLSVIVGSPGISVAETPDWRNQTDSPAPSTAVSAQQYYTPCAFVPESTPMFSACTATPAVSLSMEPSVNQASSITQDLAL